MNKRFETDNPELNEYQNKENINFRLAADVNETLEEVLFFARKEIVKTKRKKITKSEFYEAILRDLSLEYQAKGKESRLWKLLLAC
ncbi:MAG: hypothetical protein ACR2N3_05060 [Pyrinomonadaceae bacterium]